MHEAGIARELVKLADRVAAENHAQHVRALRLRIGPLAGVDADALRFAFEIAAEGTRCDSARLEIDRTVLQARCTRCCEIRDVPQVGRLICPVCGDALTDIVAGRELELEQVEVDQDDPANP